MKSYHFIVIKLLAIFCAALFLLSISCREPGVSNSDQMRADVKKLVDAARKQTRLWPWEESASEVLKVAAYGKAVAPMLLELLCDKQYA